MNEVLHANIFFIIASLGVVLLTVLACVAMVYVIKIVRAVSRITERIEAGSETVAEDIAAVREALHPRFIMRVVASIFGLRRSTRKKEEREYEWPEDESTY